ncbi:Lrp/AsnC family transcriptional regulator [Brevibacillus fluminis]|uniref:Lrp/AsnC family transcriptional regulator n=1 Tax=Brevibacillus fluminis TaxID=511487 RepID=UPI003F889FD1
MDEVDQRIVELLRANSRMSSSEISKRVHLSVPAVAERIRKLEERQIIQSFTVKLNREKLGQTLIAYIFVSIERPEHINGFKEHVLQNSAVLECHHLAGEYDYLLKVATAGTSGLETLISRELKSIPGIVKTNTIITLSSVKEEG